MKGEVTRRNFLFGTVASAAGAALILRPEGQALELFKPTLEETVAISRVDPRSFPKVRGQEGPRPDATWFDPVMPGDMLYNYKGEPVCMVTGLSITNEPLDITSVFDDGPRLMPGPRHIHIEVTPVFHHVTRSSRRAKS